MNREKAIAWIEGRGEVTEIVGWSCAWCGILWIFMTTRIDSIDASFLWKLAFVGVCILLARIGRILTRREIKRDYASAPLPTAWMPLEEKDTLPLCRQQIRANPPLWLITDDESECA